MILLSPPKLLMILVIALIVLGPDKLPSTARRVGAMWSEFKRWRAHLEGEVRATFPDLPSTTEIARAVRSPVSVLERLAEEHGAPVDDVSFPRGPIVDPPSTRRAPVVTASRTHSPPGIDASVGPDVSSMN